MQFSITLPFVFTLAIFASAAPTPTISQQQEDKIQFVAELANQLNEHIVHTTQFFGAFPRLDGLALTTQAQAAETALQDATGVILTLAQELSDNAMVQVLKAELVDNNFLLGISLQFQDFAYGMKLDIPARIPFTMNIGQPSNPFSETLGLYCSDAIPEINTLFRIVGSFVNNGITIVALPPNNCPS